MINESVRCEALGVGSLIMLGELNGEVVWSHRLRMGLTLMLLNHFVS